MPSGAVDCVFDIQTLEAERADLNRSLRSTNASRRTRKADPDQLELFSQAPRHRAAEPHTAQSNGAAAPVLSPSETQSSDKSPPTTEASRQVDDTAPERDRTGSLAIGVAEPSEELNHARDYRIMDASAVGEGTLLEKAQINLCAIKLLKTLECEAREADADEKRLLARYSGWGAMPAAFDYFTGKHDEWNVIRDSLRKLLTDAEYRAARASTPNAHYTSPLVVKAIWHALEYMGLQPGARVLEPSCGVGNFFGLMPEHLLPQAVRAGVELDSITARIAKNLYPDSTIYETGFENAPLPDNFFDVAVGNVPFGNYGVHDPRYKAWQTASIHNYFLIKTIDKLREGGVLALITSRFTMDETDSSIRDHLSEKSDLLGAIRLPNTTFKENAGTVVTTDILFLQKHASGPVSQAQEWRSLANYSPVDGGEQFPINEYFVRHPSMMLGTMKLMSGAFGMQPELIGQISRERLAAAITDGLPRSVHWPRLELPDQGSMPISLPQAALSAVKNNAYVVIDSVLKQRQDHDFVLVKCKPKTEERIRRMIVLRDYIREVFRTQLDDEGDAVIVAARKYLGRTYDRFVRTFGCLSSKENRLAFRDDPDAPLLLSLEENYDEGRGTARKAAIFEKRTLQRYQPVAKAETAAEALAVVLNEVGRLDWARMSALTGRHASELQAELGSLVFENPDTQAWETADRYLSGNVRQKLAMAREAAALDKKYLRNIAPLEAVQPADLLPHKITARLGVTWIPPDDIADFIAATIEADLEAVRVDYLADLAGWVLTVKEAVKFNVANVTTHGTARRTALDLIDDALNGKVSTVYDIISVDGGEKRVVNERQTLEAREAQQKLKDKFTTWIWADETRATRLAAIYNEKFNSIRLRTYDGSHLTFPGMNKSVLRDGNLAPHQKNAVWRILQGDCTLLAHCVGAGKTWIMTAAAMEARRIGLIKKNMMVVPNHLVEQWGAAFLQLYPQANIFVAGKDHFQSGHRERAMSRIAAGEYDAVIVSHRSFEQLPVSDRLFEEYLQTELDALERAIREVGLEKGTASRRIIKMLETAKKRVEQKIQTRANRETKDCAVSFEELGIDRIFVDEADLYKNLGFVTKMNRIAGLPQTTSNRATDMHIKTDWLRRRNGGKGVVFATGTPISNTMAELYTMQRYLAPEVLAKAGMSAFDAWAANFGEAVTALELAPSGAGYRMHTRFAKFVNLPELLTMFRDFADVQTPGMLNLPRPALKDGKNHIITSPSTPDLKAYVESLMARSEKIRAGDVDPSDDNMLKITSDGRKAALDMRLVDPTSADHPQSKIRLAANEIFNIWTGTAESRSTQLAFCDLSTPHSDRFSVYGAIRSNLLDRGIPAHEIAFIHDVETDAQKQALFNKVNSGIVRVLLGSTEKMGAGTNVQRKLFASHNIDAPWRPRDIEQRDGRILRQGNENAEVLIYRYVTEGSFDAYMWQTLETKARFIQQVMNGDTSVRTAEDVAGGALTYAEIKAIASGNPAVMEKVKVDTEIRKLDSLRSSHSKRQFDMRWKIGPTQNRISSSREQLTKVTADIMTRDTNETEEFAMAVDGIKYAGKDQREMAAAALHDTIRAWRWNSALVTCAKIQGLDILCRGDPEGRCSAFLRGETTYNVNHNAENPLGTLMSVEHNLRSLAAVQERLEADIERDEKALAEYELQAGKPFEHQARLEELLTEQARLNADLDLDKDDKQATVAQSEVESRSLTSTEWHDESGDGAPTDLGCDLAEHPKSKVGRIRIDLPTRPGCDFEGELVEARL